MSVNAEYQDIILVMANQRPRGERVTIIINDKMNDRVRYMSGWSWKSGLIFFGISF